MFVPLAILAIGCAHKKSPATTKVRPAAGTVVGASKLTSPIGIGFATVEPFRDLVQKVPIYPGAVLTPSLTKVTYTPRIQTYDLTYSTKDDAMRVLEYYKSEGEKIGIVSNLNIRKNKVGLRGIRIAVTGNTGARIQVRKGTIGSGSVFTITHEIFNTMRVRS